MKVAKSGSQKFSPQEKEICIYVMINVYQTYGGDHFEIYTNAESLCHTPEKNVCQLYFQKKILTE